MIQGAHLRDGALRDGTGEERVVRLPAGWRAPDGRVWHDAVVRPARARDEVRALGDFRVWLRPETLPHVLLARVVTRIGPHRDIGPAAIAALAPEDIAALERAYAEENGYGASGGEEGSP